MSEEPAEGAATTTLMDDVVHNQRQSADVAVVIQKEIEKQQTSKMKAVVGAGDTGVDHGPSPHEVTTTALHPASNSSAVRTAGMVDDSNYDYDFGLQTRTSSGPTKSVTKVSEALEQPPSKRLKSEGQRSATTSKATIAKRAQQGSQPTPDMASEVTVAPSPPPVAGETGSRAHKGGVENAIASQDQAVAPLKPPPPAKDEAATSALESSESSLFSVQRASSTGSLASDVSSMSAASNRRGTEEVAGDGDGVDEDDDVYDYHSSPAPYAGRKVQKVKHEYPAAPPSTPMSTSSVASASSSNSLDRLDVALKGMGDGGLPTPLPIVASTAIANADALLEEQQKQWLLQEMQQQQDGGMTPVPDRRVGDSESLWSEGPATSTWADDDNAATSTVAGSTSLSRQHPPLPEDFSEWAVGDRYELVRMLGRGSYGEVAQAIDLSVGRRDAFVAIKRIQSPFDQEIDAIRLYREIHILRRMRGHECIIQLLDIVQPPTDDIDDFHDLYMVFEYVDTDLYKLVMSPQYLTTEHIQTFLYQMLVALKYIHSFSVIHRDLKPANILLNEDCSLKICDFGLARIVDSATIILASSQHGKKSTELAVPPRSPPVTFGNPPKTGLTRQLTKHVVTRWYRAPELILIQPYTSAVDIWSVGCILAELLSMQDGNVPSYQDRKPIFPGGFCYPLSGEGDRIKKDDRLDQLNMIFKVIGTPSQDDVDSVGKASEYVKSLGEREGVPLEKLYPVADPQALDLLRLMLQFNPAKRLTASEALEHNFFKGIRRQEFERVADGPLTGPDFLETQRVDLRVLKQKTLEEVLWFRDQGGTKR